MSAALPVIPTQPWKIDPAKKCIVMGFASTSRDLAPTGDTSFEVFGLNHAYSFMTRYTRWFEMHGPEHYRKDLERNGQLQTGHFEWLKSRPPAGQPNHVPIYMQDVDPDIPASVKYPRAEINAWLRSLGNNQVGYFSDDYETSSISQMLLVAMLEGFGEIHIYGVDLLQDEEYCVAPQTRVLTADLRWVEAGTLAVGDDVIAFDEYPQGKNSPDGSPYRRWRCSKVEKAQRLRLPSRRIHLANGETIECSAEHRWLVAQGKLGNSRWLTTDRLCYPGKPNYRGFPSRIIKLLDPWEEDRSWDAGYLAAAFDGEGHVHQKPNDNAPGGKHFRIGYGQKSNAMADEVLAALARKGFEYGAANPRASGVTNYTVNGGKAETLRFMGSIRPRRLLQRFKPDCIGYLKMSDRMNVPVTFVEDIGERDVIGLKTTTSTFLADGYASHNSYQRPGAEYLIGLARGLGIKVYVPPQSALCKANYMYGISEPGGGKSIEELLTFFEAKGAQAGDMMNRAAAETNVTDGAMQMANMVKGWLGELKIPDGPERQELEKRIEAKAKELQARHANATKGTYTLQGQAEMAKTCGVWGRAWQRGTKLVA